MPKTDLVKQFKAYYTAKPRVEELHIAPTSYVSLKGKGDPSMPAYAEALQALYTMAYSIKFSCKQREQNFVVPKLEGLWWYDRQKFGKPGVSQAPVLIPRKEWEYRMLIRLPDFVSDQDIMDARRQVIQKKGIGLLDKVERYEMTEGRCVQILHIGPFETEPESLALIEAYIQEKGLKRNGEHHEIYLSDFRKTAPAKLRTILREPVK